MFKNGVTDPSVLDDCDIPDEWKNILLSNIKRRLTPQAVKCRADIEVSCYSYEGIDAIKNSLKEGLKFSTEDKPIKINLIAPPVYVVTSSSLDRDGGWSFLEGRSRTLIFGGTVMDAHFSKNGHERSFLVGRSWTVILVKTIMDGHFSKDAHGWSFLVGR